MVSQPLVTVLMPVYNGEKYLSEAIESILRQTFKDFELLIIDDYSTDRSKEIIESYNDHRIRLEENRNNLGLIGTLNRGIDLSNGKYIARMDQDDISLPTRLAEQLIFMQENPKIGISGTGYRTIGLPSAAVFYPSIDNHVLKINLLFACVFAHPTVIMRKDFLKENGLHYEPSYFHAEDYGLWTKAARYFDFGNVPRPLLFYRIHPKSISRTYHNIQSNSTKKVREDYLRNLGFTFSFSELSFHQELVDQRVHFSKSTLVRAHTWFKKLGTQNQMKKIFPEPLFSQILGEHLTGFSLRGKNHLPAAFKMHYQSGFFLKLSWKHRLTFFLRSFFKNLFP